MIFDHIQPSIYKGNLVLLLSNNKDASVTVEAVISEERLIEMYRSEFLKLKFHSPNNGNSSYHTPTADYISLERWADENVNEKRAWEIWEDLRIGERNNDITIVTNY